MQDQDNQKNLLIAIALSMGVLFAWQFFFAAPREQERQARIKQEQTLAKAKEQAAPTAPGAPGTSPPAGAPPAADAAAPATRQGALEASPRVGIQTPSLIGSVSLKGGRIDDLV